MFTDIMAAFGVSQNGFINLLYEITVRKEKEKITRPIAERDESQS